MSDFQKEHRYYVFKLKNLLEDQKQRLYALQMELGPWNDVPECVVVEADWPNYQDTWSDIQAVSEGRFTSRAELQAERDALALQLKASEENARQQRDMKAKAREQRDALVSKMVILHESVTQAVNLIPAGAIDIISNIKTAQDMNTAQALAEIRAEAGRAGFIAAYHKINFIRMTEENIEWYADQYAAKVRQGGE